MSARPDDAHQRVKDLVHRDKVLQAEVTRTLALYREVNRKFYNPPEMNDLRRHYEAIDALPELLRMLNEEIQIIKRHGQRPSPFWDYVDQLA